VALERGRNRTAVAALAAYCLLAVLYLGVRLLEPGRQYVGYDVDPQLFMWAFAWWPHAILHGQNPFVTHAIWAPGGVNLTWATSVPGLALLFSPLTLLFGPVASYNTAAILIPALNAWTAFLLCRRLTRSFWPSLVGGYLFGFSSYVLGQTEGHPHMSAVFLLPLVVLVVLRFLDGELDARGLIVRLGLLLALELLFSTELTFTLALALVGGLALAFALVPTRRSRLKSLVPAIIGAYAFAGVVTSPFLYYALTDFQRGALHVPEHFVTDLLNFVVPTKLVLGSHGFVYRIAQHFPGNDSEQGAYIGLPALILVALYARTAVRTPAGRFLIAALGLAVLAALGSQLVVNGHRVGPLPWRAVVHEPLFNNVLTDRLSVFVSLVVAATVALWTAARRPGALRWALPALAVIALIPNPAAGRWATDYTVPPFFTSSAYRACIDPGETVLPLPISNHGHSMLWQAVNGFRFRIAGGYIAPTPPPSYQTGETWGRVVADEPIPASDAEAFTSFIREKHVTTVIAQLDRADEWSAALDTIAKPHWAGGVVIWKVTGAPWSCAGR